MGVTVNQYWLLAGVAVSVILKPPRFQLFAVTQQIALVAHSTIHMLSFDCFTSTS